MRSAQKGWKKGYTAVSDFIPGHDAENAFKKGYTDAGGEIIGSVRFPTNNPDFAKDAGTNPLIRFPSSMGLAKGSARSQEENAANAFAENLSAFALAKSSVIGVDYTSGDADLAANIANRLADVYINWQREEKFEQSKDATAWLSTQIEPPPTVVKRGPAGTLTVAVTFCRAGSTR